MADEYVLDSSDDEHSNDYLKKKPTLKSENRISSFEKEMQLTLNEKFSFLQAEQDFVEPRYEARDKQDDSAGPNKPEPQAASSFFDCDGENLYDPEEDDKNDAWVQKRRKKYQVTGDTKPPKSDAILNCPACFTTLCHDCQRHETYQSQYRAMFTCNCIVDMSQTLKYPAKEEKTKRKGKSRPDDSSQEEYHPVKCEVCGTQVAVFDSEEVYHFFNVLASH